MFVGESLFVQTNPLQRPALKTEPEPEPEQGGAGFQGSDNKKDGDRNTPAPIPMIYRGITYLGALLVIILFIFNLTGGVWKECGVIFKESGCRGDDAYSCTEYAQYDDDIGGAVFGTIQLKYTGYTWTEIYDYKDYDGPYMLTKPDYDGFAANITEAIALHDASPGETTYVSLSLSLSL